MAYDIPSSIDLSAGFIPFIKYLNVVTYFAFVRFALISLAVIIFLAYYRANNDIKGGLIIVGIIISFISVFLRMLGLLPIPDMSIIIGATLVGLIYLWFSK